MFFARRRRDRRIPEAREKPTTTSARSHACKVCSTDAGQGSSMCETHQTWRAADRLALWIWKCGRKPASTVWDASQQERIAEGYGRSQVWLARCTDPVSSADPWPNDQRTQCVTTCVTAGSANEMEEDASTIT